jgi:peptidyl-lysine (3S)-dioxygenase / protease
MSGYHLPLCPPPWPPWPPVRSRFPLYRHAEPLRVAVRAGELLYLPSMWYHQVAAWLHM